MPSALIDRYRTFTALRQISAQAARVAHTTLNLFLPTTCLFCREIGLYCCTRCSKRLSDISPALACTGCNLHRHCDCLTPDWKITRTWSLANYVAPIDRVIGGIKFHSQIHDAKILGGLIANTLLNSSPPLCSQIGEQFLHICAVPLTAAREKHRGFNQAAILAKAAASELARHSESLRVEFHHDLIRNGFSKRSSEHDRLAEKPLPQSQRSRHERLANASHSFVCTKSISGTVLVIDDVMTTGATINRCAQTLLAAGASTVWAAVAARTQKPTA